MHPHIIPFTSTQIRRLTKIDKRNFVAKKEQQNERVGSQKAAITVPEE